MKHVFVETNWVVASSAPVHERMPAALELVERAKRGEIRLHLPSICLGEARHPIRSKYQPRTSADAIRKFLAWTALQQDSEITDTDVIRRALDRFESRVLAELDELPATLEGIRKIPGLEVFALDEQMLSRSVELSSEDLNLKPYDQAILAAVLVRAEQLRDAGEEEFYFCELDGDLQPWDKKGASKQPLTSLYDRARVWVYQDFSMNYPSSRPGFFRRQA